MFIREINSVEEYSNFLKRDGIVIVKISANWCQPCKLLGQRILDMDAIDGVEIGEIDVDNEEFDSLCQELNIRNIPVLIYFKDGVEVDRTIGLVDANNIASTVAKHAVA